MQCRGWTCYLCNKTIIGRQQQNRHKSNLWKLADDPTRCDHVATNNTTTPAPAIITRPIGKTELARRATVQWDTERNARAAYIVRRNDILDTNHRCRNLIPVQNAWDAHLDVTKDLCSDEFWQVFLPIHSSPRVHIDTTLRAVKKVFVQPEDRKKFPIDLRSLRKSIAALKPFWPKVLHTYRIDLSKFAKQLPSGTTHLMFHFVDPIWGWLQAARRQHPLEMHWKPAAQRSSHKVYGGGIQFGEFFRHACSNIPEGSSVMCAGLHWDGTRATGVSSAPICVCVGNSNSCNKSTQYCTAYVPHIPDEKRPEWKKQPCATTLKFYVRQECAAAILRVMEEAAVRGVICRLPNQKGEEIERMLFPRLSSMNFDQPEAQLFFGLRNKYSCSKCRSIIIYDNLYYKSSLHMFFISCRRRKGYSAFKRCRP